MFCCEIKFLIDICKKFLKSKFKTTLELSFEIKNKFRKHNPLDLDMLCSICGFEIGVCKRYGASSEKMTYCDFVIRKEYHFLTNIFSREEIEVSDSLC